VATGSGTTASANISPLTEAVVNQLTDDPVALFANFDKSSAAKLTDSSVANAQKTVIANLVSNGLTVPATLTDFIKAPLVAAKGSTSGNDYDKLLDNMATQTYPVKIIAMNDFHGNIQSPASSNGGTVTLPNGAAGVTVNVGGAAYVATAIKTLKSAASNSVVVGAGDLTGASPFASSITHDEAAVDVLNQFGLDVTSVGRRLGLAYMGLVGCLSAARIATLHSDVCSQDYLRLADRIRLKLNIKDTELCPIVAGDCPTRIAQLRVLRAPR